MRGPSDFNGATSSPPGEVQDPAENAEGPTFKQQSRQGHLKTKNRQLENISIEKTGPEDPKIESLPKKENPEVKEEESEQNRLENANEISISSSLKLVAPVHSLKDFEEGMHTMSSNYYYYNEWYSDVRHNVGQVSKRVLGTFSSCHRKMTLWDAYKLHYSLANYGVYRQLLAIIARVGEYQSWTPDALRMLWWELLSRMNGLSLQTFGGFILDLYKASRQQFYADQLKLYLDGIDQRRVVVEREGLRYCANLVLLGWNGVEFEVSFRYFQPCDIDKHMKLIEMEIEAIAEHFAKTREIPQIVVLYLVGKAKKKEGKIKKLLTSYFESNQRSQYYLCKSDEVPGRIIVTYQYHSK